MDAQAVIRALLAAPCWLLGVLHDE